MKCESRNTWLMSLISSNFGWSRSGILNGNFSQVASIEYSSIKRWNRIFDCIINIEQCDENERKQKTEMPHRNWNVWIYLFSSSTLNIFIRNSRSNSNRILFYGGFYWRFCSHPVNFFDWTGLRRCKPKYWKVL